MKYHINPRTGVPSACYAKRGKCPYEKNGPHYDTFGDAQAAAFDLMEQKYPIFNDIKALDEDYEIIHPEELDLFRDIQYTLESENSYNFLEDLTDEEIKEELETTTDRQLLDSVLSRRILVESDNDDEVWVNAVARNPRFPKKWKDSVIAYPDNYNIEFVKSVIKNQDMTENELFTLAQGTISPNVQRTALSSPQISKASILKNVGMDGMKPCPELALYFAYNPNTPIEIRSNLDWRLNKLRNEKREKARN